MIARLRRGAALLSLSARTTSFGLPSVALELVAVATQLGVFYFLSAIVDSGRLAQMGHPGSGYFSFVVPGMALTGALLEVVRGVLDDYRQGQLTGTLELLFLAPISSGEIVLWRSLWHLGRGTARATIMIGMAALMGFAPPEARWDCVLATWLVASLAFLPFAFLSAAWVLVTRRTQPILMIVGGATAFFAGAYFPLEVLPALFVGVAKALPLVHVVTALRLALAGASVGDVVGPLGISAGWTLLAVPASAYAYYHAVRRARRQGTLGHY